MALRKGLQPAPALSWPEQWEGNLQGSRRRSVKLLAGFAILALLAVVSTTADLTATFAAISAIFLNFAITSFLASHLDLRRGINQVTLRQTSGGPEIFIPVHRWYKMLYHITHIAALIVGLTWIYIASLGEYDGPRVFFVYLTAFTIAPLITLWSLARLSSRLLFRLRGPQMGLSVSASGISQASWWGKTHFDWRHIKEVRMTRSQGPKLIGRGQSPAYVFNVGLPPTEQGKERLRGRFPRPPVAYWPMIAYRAMMIDVAELDLYPPVVPHLLSFYFEHPELRYELGTDKAVERVRSGDFVA